MSNEHTSRRSFLKGGALLAAPLAAASVSAAVITDSSLQTRLAHLEDEAAIRRLHHHWLRQVNAGEPGPHLDGSVRRLMPHHAGAPDRIDIAADGRSAVGTFDQAVELELPLATDTTLAQMAHVQGGGSVRYTERQRLSVAYVKSDGAWTIGKVERVRL